METINVYEAKTQLSRLLERAEAGEEIIITRHGRPVACLGPVSKRREPRRLGQLKGKIRMRKDFDAPLPEEILAGYATPCACAAYRPIIAIRSIAS